MMCARELSARVPEIDVFCVHPGLAFTPLYFKAKSLPEYPLCALIKLMGPFFGQTAKRGSESTLYAAGLAGKRFAYFCPSIVLLNLCMTAEQKPGNAAVRNAAACWRMFEETCHILESIVGPKFMHIPCHPDDVFSKQAQSWLMRSL